VIAVQPAIEGIRREIGRVLRHHGGVAVMRVAKHDPSHVRPEAAVTRRMRVAVLVGVLVVHAVRRHPEDGAPLERERAAHREEVLECFRCLVAAVRMQPVIPEADTKADGHPVQDEGDEDIGPREEEERGNGAHMEQRHEDGRDPVDVAQGVGRVGRSGLYGHEPTVAVPLRPVCNTSVNQLSSCRHAT
jgi:hypothetical protein